MNHAFTNCDKQSQSVKAGIKQISETQCIYTSTGIVAGQRVNHWILFYAMLEKVRINSYLLFLHLGFDLLMSPCLFLEPILSKPIFLDIFFS